MTPCIDNYRDLPLGKYEEIIKANDIENDIDRQVAVLAILTGLSERELLNLPIAEYSALAAKTAYLQTPVPKVSRPASRYTAGKFTLIPTTDLRKITAAQYIDFQTLAPQGDKHIVEILSCFLVPEGCKYNDGYDIIEVQTAIREDLSVMDALCLSAFFLKKYAALTRSTRISLEKALRTERDPKRRARMLAAMTRMQVAVDSLTAGAGSPA